MQIIRLDSERSDQIKLGISTVYLANKFRWNQLDWSGSIATRESVSLLISRARPGFESLAAGMPGGYNESESNHSAAGIYPVGRSRHNIAMNRSRGASSI